MGVRSAALQHVCDLVQRGSPDALRAAEVAAREHGAFALNAAGGITATEAATCRRLVDELVEHVEGAAGRAGSRAHAWALLAVLAAELDTQSILARQEAWMAAATKVIRTEQNAASLAAASNCAGVLVARLEPLLGLPGVKRSASAAASKLISSTAQRIENVDSARAGTADRNGANGAAEADTPSPLPLPLLLLLESATRTMPASARPHIKAIEAVVFRRLDASTQPSDAELLAAARTAALVPAATGTPQAWSLSAAASVFALHVVCDRMFGKPVASSDPAFHAHAAAEAALAPLEGAAAGGTAAARLWMTRDAAAQLDPAACVHVATAAICAIEAHLALPFPVPVPLPAGPLANAACRLLAADAAQDPAVALRLPQLHAAALELLGLLVRRGGAAVAPQHCTIAAAVNVQLAIAAAGEDSLPPAARLAAYRAVAALADAGGGRVACDLVPALLSAAIQDVFATSGKSDTAPRPTGRTKSKSAKKTPGGGLPDAAAMAAADPYLAGLCGADRTHRRGACQAAALHALAATLRAGGPLLAPDTRALADAVAARAARAAARALESHRLAPMPGGPGALPATHRAALAALQAAAMALGGARAATLPLARQLATGTWRAGASEAAVASAAALDGLAIEAWLHGGAALPPGSFAVQALADADTEGARNAAAPLPALPPLPRAAAAPASAPAVGLNPPPGGGIAAERDEAPPAKRQRVSPPREQQGGAAVPAVRQGVPPAVPSLPTAQGAAPGGHVAPGVLGGAARPATSEGGGAAPSAPSTRDTGEGGNGSAESSSGDESLPSIDSGSTGDGASDAGSD